MELALWGFGGGVAMEVLRFFRIRDELHRGLPDWAKSWLYWVVTLAMALVGALLVVMHQGAGDVQLNPALAFNIGVSAPLLLTSLTKQVPPIQPGEID